MLETICNGNGNMYLIDFSQNVIGQPENVHGSMCGVVLLLFFLCFDSFTSQWQTRMFQLNKSLSPLQMMLIMKYGLFLIEIDGCIYSYICILL